MASSSSSMPYSIRQATHDDIKALVALLPRLADFEVPADRDPKDLWFGDSKLLEKAITGKAPDSHVLVAADADNTVVGVAMYTIKPELLSGASSAHLESLAVDAGHTRQGLGQKLIDATATAAVHKGATCMSLHVFSNNERARALYKASGFNEELIRCYKPIGPGS